jgi:putative acetyltransferase
MIEIVRTDSAHPDFVALVRELDALLASMNGEQHSFYHQFNSIDLIRHAVVAYLDGRAVSCGAIKEFAPDTMEVKRMFTQPAVRGRGAASAVLAELESWAGELGYSRCVLETGRRHVEAIGLYEKKGYLLIENYGQYVGVVNSVCYARELASSSTELIATSTD